MKAARAVGGQLNQVHGTYSYHDFIFIEYGHGINGLMNR